MSLTAHLASMPRRKKEASAEQTSAPLVAEQSSRAAIQNRRFGKFVILSLGGALIAGAIIAFGIWMW